MSAHLPLGRLVASLCTALALACSSAPAVDEAQAAWPERGPAPTPYTAEQIRAANPDGTEVVFRLERHGGETVLQTMRFVDGDAAGVTVESSYTTVDGEPAGESASQRATWAELRDHAAFDAANTVRGEGHETVGAGSFDCWIYQVRAPTEGDDPAVVQRFAFAKGRAGPPVLLEVFAGEMLITRMELVEVRQGG